MKGMLRTTRDVGVRRLAVLTSLIALPACDVFAPSCDDCGGFPIAATTPARFDLAPGDSASVTVMVANIPGPRNGLPIRWRSADPAVVRVDSVGATGRPVVLQALAPGETVLLGEIAHQGRSLPVRVPVTVRSRP